ncbi:MAG: hypothetical protein ACYTGH_00590 [Planctomycetota bacterium]|jgi:hypothetical protein
MQPSIPVPGQSLSEQQPPVAVEVMSSVGGAMADDPEEILPMTYLETPEEAQAEAMAVPMMPGGSISATAQTARYNEGGMATASTRTSGRTSESMRSGRTGPKSQAQLAREKKARVIIIVGMVLVNGLGLSLAVLHYTGTLGEWLGY